MGARSKGTNAVAQPASSFMVSGTFLPDHGFKWAQRHSTTYGQVLPREAHSVLGFESVLSWTPRRGASRA